MTWAAFVAQVVPQAWSGDCDRGCCAAQEPACCAIEASELATSVSTLRLAHVPSEEAETRCPLCATASDRILSPTDGSPCHCQLDAKQDQPYAVHGAKPSQRDDLPVWGEVVDTSSPGAPRGPDASRTYAVASQSIPIRPVRILYGVWRT